MKSYRFKLSTINYQLSTSSRAGFTLVELLIYMGITAIVVSMFTGILVTVARIQSRQTSSSRSINETGFLMNTIKRMVHESIDLAVPDSGTLDLVISTTTVPITTARVQFNSASSSIILNENGPGGTSVSTLSSNNIRIDEVVFTDKSNGLSKVVDISITGTVFPNNETQLLTKTLRSSAALYVQEQ